MDTEGQKQEKLDTELKHSSKKNTSLIIRISVDILFICIAFFIYTTLHSWKTDVQDKILNISNLLGQTRNYVTTYVNEFGKTHLDKKLVVLTQDITVEVSKELNNRILWDWVSVGSANSKFRFIDNKVQYYVPLDEIKTDNILYDPTSKTIKIIAPKVRLDKDMVSVQSDPAKVIKEENGSWSPFGPRLKEVSNEIMSEVKNEVIRAGYHELVKDKAQVEVQKTLENFFNMALHELLIKENLQLQIIMP